jgi:hypothetical protein
VTGNVPGSRGKTWFIAERLELGAEPGILELHAVQLAVRSEARLAPVLRLRSDEARISGLPLAASAQNALHGVPRALAVATTALGLGALLAWWCLRRAIELRLHASLLGAAGGLAGFAVFRLCEQGSSWLASALVPGLAGGVVSVALGYALEKTRALRHQ